MNQRRRHSSAPPSGPSPEELFFGSGDNLPGDDLFEEDDDPETLAAEEAFFGAERPLSVRPSRRVTSDASADRPAATKPASGNPAAKDDPYPRSVSQGRASRSPAPRRGSRWLATGAATTLLVAAYVLDPLKLRPTAAPTPPLSTQDLKRSASPKTESAGAAAPPQPALLGGAQPSSPTDSSAFEPRPEPNSLSAPAPSVMGNSSGGPAEHTARGAMVRGAPQALSATPPRPSTRPPAGPRNATAAPLVPATASVPQPQIRTQ